MKDKEINLKEYSVTDLSNVCGIFPLKKDEGLRETIKLDGFKDSFKLVINPKIKLVCDTNFSGEVFEINGSRYSKEYINQIKKMGSVWFGEDLKIYMSYDEKKEEILKDKPIVILFGNNLCFVLAPRIKSGDEE